jgi:hypothetical protein
VTIAKTDLALALDKHKYVTRPGGTPGVNVTAISGLLDDGKSGAFAGSAVKLTKAGIDYRAEWKAKGERGTRVHAHCEAFLRGEAADVAEDESGFVDAVDKFMVDHDPKVLELEQVVISAVGYGGRFDMIVEMQSGEWAGKTGLVDLKTGKRYPVEHTLQLSAYLHSDGIAVYDEEGTLTGTRPLPLIDFCACLYVREDGTYSLVEYPASSEAWEHFCHLVGVYNWCRTDEMKALVKAARA